MVLDFFLVRRRGWFRYLVVVAALTVPGVSFANCFTIDNALWSGDYVYENPNFVCSDAEAANGCAIASDPQPQYGMPWRKVKYYCQNAVYDNFKTYCGKFSGCVSSQPVCSSSFTSICSVSGSLYSSCTPGETVTADCYSGTENKVVYPAICDSGVSQTVGYLVSTDGGKNYNFDASGTSFSKGGCDYALGDYIGTNPDGTDNPNSCFSEPESAHPEYIYCTYTATSTGVKTVGGHSEVNSPEVHTAASVATGLPAPMMTGDYSTATTTNADGSSSTVTKNVDGSYTTVNRDTGGGVSSSVTDYSSYGGGGGVSGGIGLFGYGSSSIISSGGVAYTQTASSGNSSTYSGSDGSVLTYTLGSSGDLTMDLTFADGSTSTTTTLADGSVSTTTWDSGQTNWTTVVTAPDGTATTSTGGTGAASTGGTGDSGASGTGSTGTTGTGSGTDTGNTGSGTSGTGTGSGTSGTGTGSGTSGTGTGGSGGAPTVADCAALSASSWDSQPTMSQSVGCLKTAVWAKFSIQQLLDATSNSSSVSGGGCTPISFTIPAPISAVVSSSFMCDLWASYGDLWVHIVKAAWLFAAVILFLKA